MGKRYLIDTNVLIEYTGNLLPKSVAVQVGKIIDEEFCISFVNKIEVLGHASALSDLVEFVNTATVYYADNEIVERTILVRKHKKIKLPDAILAATAIVHNFTLLTRNTEDFIGIIDLKIENPWDWKHY